MDLFGGIMKGMMNRGKEKKVFDWDKAAQLILEKNAREVDAGLREDWSYTAGNIYSDGEIVALSNVNTLAKIVQRSAKEKDDV